ncbi:MAG: caspase family protein [Bacteroidales bacterium]|nr:caspase family protein [Bacteroidales bacterium]
MKLRFLIFITILSIFMPYYATAQNRIALLIGNSNYTYQSKLNNPANDATDLAASLCSLNFEVIVYTDLTQGNMIWAINKFGEKLQDKQIGFFFFSGHGSQAKGENFIYPIDANPGSEAELESECVNVNRTLGKMQTAGCRLNIVILDACRNNPFESAWKGRGRSRGLALVRAPSGTIIGYATAPGELASDGSGRNSPYTSALLKYLNQPGLEILDIFKRVGKSVLNGSGGKQEPWFQGNVTDDFYLTSRPQYIEPSPKIRPELSVGRNTVTDIDGNVYKTVKIGNQVWMAENLKVTHYLNGDPIPQVSSYKEWSALQTGAYCCYTNDPTYVNIHGLLYNWFAVNDPRGLAPKDWHIPSEKEWQELEKTLGMSMLEIEDNGYFGFRGKDEGGKLKGTTHWASPNTGATNESGFSAFASGSRNMTGAFCCIGTRAFFWTSTKNGNTHAWFRGLQNDKSSIQHLGDYKQPGYSIRCIHN